MHDILQKQPDIVIYPAVFARCHACLAENTIFVIQGKVNLSEERGNAVAVDSLMTMDEFTDKCSRLYLRFTDETEYMRERALKILQSHRGYMPVYLHNADQKKTQRVSENMYVRRKSTAFDELCDLLGEENVKITEDLKI